MRVLIIADSVFAVRERTLLSRLEVGLADEGVRVVHAIPQSLVGTLDAEVFKTAAAYEGRGPILTRSLRVKHLVSQLGEDTTAERPVDLIHAFGGACWSMALELARQTGASLAFEVWRTGQVNRARTMRPSGRDTVAPVFFAPDAAIERALLREGLGISVRVTPWGVHTQAEVRKIFEPDKHASVFVAGAGHDRAGFCAAIEGLGELMKDHDHVMVFVDAVGARRANIWPLAERMGILERLTLIPDFEGRRELALRGDVLVIPEKHGEHRSILLDAMAAGMAVVSAADPMVSALTDGRTAKLVQSCEPAQWAAAVGQLLDDTESARAMGASAHAYVKQEHRVSAHVASVLDAYEWMTSKEAIPFKV